MRLPLAVAALPFIELAKALDPRPSKYRKDPGATTKDRPMNQMAAKMRSEERQARKAAKRQRQVDAGGWR